MCAPPDSTWSDPMLWKSIVFGMSVVGVLLGARLVAELKALNQTAAAMAEQPSAHQIVDEVRDSRAKLISAIAMLGRGVDRVGSKIEDLTAVERRKHTSS